MKLMHKLLLIVLAIALAFSSVAQTGRIAHFSRGGSAAALVVAAVTEDNFGTPVPYFHTDSLRYISDSTVLVYGGWRYCSDCKDRKNPQLLTLKPKMSAAAAARYLKQNYIRQPRLVGFDSVTKPVRQDQRKLKRSDNGKPTGQGQAFPKRPFQYSYWRGLAGVATLGAVGWLLGKKRIA